MGRARGLVRCGFFPAVLSFAEVVFAVIFDRASAWRACTQQAASYGQVSSCADIHFVSQPVPGSQELEARVSALEADLARLHRVQ